jgi:thiol-disulfide isomerase/thioredoxin
MLKSLFILLLVLPLSLLSQNLVIQTVDFKGFEPWLNKSNDTTYVINFWATWCAPCVKELPDFEELNKKYKSKKFKMLLVSLDFMRMKESRLLPFIAQHKLKAQVLHLNEPDANLWIGIVNPTWSGAIPATLIYNRNNRVFHEGSYTFKELDSIVKRIIIN